MATVLIKIKTIWALGPANLWRVFRYRIGIRLGLNPVKKLTAVIPEGAFFSSPRVSIEPSLKPNLQWQGQQRYFGWLIIDSDQVPDWHLNPFNGKSVNRPNRPWWQIVDFDSQVGDIKTIWEASRFDWVLTFAQQACTPSSDVVDNGVDKLNHWLNDWLKHNPAYLGPNWKCGQEASIRVMHLAMAAIILKQFKATSPALLALIEAHLKRIEPTLLYAMAQDNNHGTSEAAALFIGGNWLATNGVKQGNQWQNTGLKWLENRAARLIGQDGNFSQYSVNYHRVMLDTFCMAEVWRRATDARPFSDALYGQLARATNWLYQLIQPQNGDAPNIGANDGARLLPLTDTDYRDFRPSMQLAMALFSQKCAYQGEGQWNLPLQWLDIDVPIQMAAPPDSCEFQNDGYRVLRSGAAMALLNYPKYRFRPGQSDGLHLDFWWQGENLLRDAGTYGYAIGEEAIHYYGGTQSHNTIQFDARDQMPRISRFLLGDWLTFNTHILANLPQHSWVGYTDGQGATHKRLVRLDEQQLTVQDEVAGFREKAVLRWRLKPGDWLLKGAILSLDEHQLCFHANVPIHSIKLVQGWESRYYLKRNSTPVVEIQINRAGCLTTEYKYKL